ncbi:hypothetical protein CFE70_009366 [Pyrenophora teres f. teres 0-1]
MYTAQSTSITPILVAPTNPKKADELCQSSLEVAPAYASMDIETQGEVQLSTNSGTRGDAEETAALMDGMYTFFAAEVNCDESFLFAYYNGMVAGMFSSAGLGKPTQHQTPIRNHCVACTTARAGWQTKLG